MSNGPETSSEMPPEVLKELRFEEANKLWCHDEFMSVEEGKRLGEWAGEVRNRYISCYMNQDPSFAATMKLFSKGEKENKEYVLPTEKATYAFYTFEQEFRDMKKRGQLPQPDEMEKIGEKILTIAAEAAIKQLPQEYHQKRKNLPSVEFKDFFPKAEK